MKRLIPTLFFVMMLFSTNLGICTDRMETPPLSGLRNHVKNPDTEPLDPDNYPKAINYARLHRENGPLNKIGKKYRLGAVMKFFGNPYWRQLADGMRRRADDFDLFIKIKAAAAELDIEHQRLLMEEMISEGYDVLFVSPQTLVTRENMDNPLPDYPFFKK